MRSRILSITRPRAQNRRVIFTLMVALFAAIAATPSFAKGRWYLDVGGGTGVVANPTALLPTASAGVSGIGAVALMHDFQQHGVLLSFQMGLAERYVMVGGNQFLTSNLLFRSEVGPFFLGFGGSPYILATPNRDASLTHSPGYSVIAEGGYDWKIIPTFSITVSGALEFVNVMGTLGPAPSVETTVCFRFYFGQQYDPTKRSPYDGDGWRYPRGIEIR